MNRPKIEPLDNGHYRLLKPYMYSTNAGSAIIVPKGYITNGADIPRFFWRLYPPFSPEYMPAVIVHDYLCDEAEQKGNDKQLYLLADEVFREILLKLGVSRVRATIFYKAVRFYSHRLICRIHRFISFGIKVIFNRSRHCRAYWAR